MALLESVAVAPREVFFQTWRRSTRRKRCIWWAQWARRSESGMLWQLQSRHFHRLSSVELARGTRKLAVIPIGSTFPASIFCRRCKVSAAGLAARAWKGGLALKRRFALNVERVPFPCTAVDKFAVDCNSVRGSSSREDGRAATFPILAAVHAPVDS